MIPKPGHQFIVADFSAIEARVLAWLAGEEWVLEAFRNGEDLYCSVASQMFGVPVVKHGINGDLRQKGKIATLACGYQGSVGAMVSMGAIDMGLKESELQDIIDSWREANPHIVQFWWDVEKAAVDTIKDHQIRKVNRIGFEFSANTLWIVLPSGRKLAYIKPRMQPNRFGRMAITFEGLNAANKWSRGETYGGKLVENCIAAGTLVLTHRGLIPIEEIKKEDVVWDGEAWVRHEGVIEKGVQETVEVQCNGRIGIRMTADHKILTKSSWRACSEAGGLDWETVRLPDSIKPCGKRCTWKNTVEMPLLLRERDCGCGERLEEIEQGQEILWMHDMDNDQRVSENSWHESSSCLRSLAQHEAALSRSKPSCLPQLRRAWHHGLRTLAAKTSGKIWVLPGRRGWSWIG